MRLNLRPLGLGHPERLSYGYDVCAAVFAFSNEGNVSGERLTVLKEQADCAHYISLGDGLS